MAEKKEKVRYSKSTAQVDLETRLADDAVPVFDDKVNPAPVSEDGYVGVSPEYQNAAVETDEPLESEEGGFADAEKAFTDAYGDSSGTPSEAVQKAYAVQKEGSGTNVAASESDAPAEESGSGPAVTADTADADKK